MNIICVFTIAENEMGRQDEKSKSRKKEIKRNTLENSIPEK